MGKHRQKVGPLLAVAAIAVGVGACGGSGGPTGGPAGAAAISGELTISGSSTVEPITSLVAEKFQADNQDVSISVNGPGTTDGFALFCEGKTQISDASREIEPEEVDACKKAGIDFIELKIGIDGITVLTSPDNDAVDCLDFNDLYALLGPESEGFENWSDANSLGEKLGASHTPYPDAPLVVTGPGEESGTWGSFIDLALKGIGEGRGLDEVTTRPDYQSSPNDNVIIQGIEGSPSSLGWVGFAYYEQTGGATKAIAIDGGDGCIEPTTQTIEDRSYPLSRDLYIYVNSKEAESNDAVAAFVDYYLSDQGLASVQEVGYVSQPDEELAATQEAWDSRRSGAGS
ncbi:MAG: phosphate transport system substrate-binding protein [Actinomycetota bacterium]|nr:phosphate transport system substrate-binding protein [Actinomycetota bacterium]